MAHKVRQTFMLKYSRPGQKTGLAVSALEIRKLQLKQKKAVSIGKKLIIERRAIRNRFAAARGGVNV